MSTIYVRDNIGYDVAVQVRIKSLLNKYFDNVVFYKQSLKHIVDLHNFSKEHFSNIDFVINLDKNLEDLKVLVPVINIDVSRLFNLKAEYVKHRFTKPSIMPKKSKDPMSFLIYDNDIINGYGVRLVKEYLEDTYHNCTVNIASNFSSILGYELKKGDEILDLADLTRDGIRFSDNPTIRIPYLTNEVFLQKFVSIPKEKYLEFKTEYLKAIDETTVSVSQRVKAMHLWAQVNNRKSFIVGISGGVDSAVTLALLKDMQETYPQAGYNIVPVIAPIYDSKGTTEQREATHLAMLVCDHVGLSYTKVSSLGYVSDKLRNAINPQNSSYLQQQADYWIRPAVFHNIAEQYDNSCMVGTTNFSEWSIGWFSQYLDIFNLMPIIDLYKSEVYKLAEYYNIPKGITVIPPKGGLVGSVTDEEALGFTYDDVEKHLEASVINAAIHKRIVESDFKRNRFKLSYVFFVKQNMK